MGKMINIENNNEHLVSEVICVKCYRRWIAVRPKSTLLKEIECPTCGQGYVIESGQIIEDLNEQ